VPSPNQQRREAAARRLQKQLEERRAREAARKRTTLVVSIVGTIVLIAAVIVVVVVSSGGNDSKNNQSKPGGVGNTATRTSSPPTTAPTSSAPPLAAPVACSKPPKGDTAKFDGVTVTGATDLKHGPTVKSLSEQAPKALECMDLVVGHGKPATPTSTVSVQYTGVLYQNGQLFDSSWQNGGKPVQFPLTGVVPGFTQGIGGIGKVAPMREGGRRIVIIPAALGYGSSANGSIPANSPLVFVIDLTSVDS
jgi:peptidylprolyl isomerase